MIVHSVPALRTFQRVMLVCGFIGGSGWALLPNPTGQLFGVFSVVTGLLGGLGSWRIDSLQAAQDAPRRIIGQQRILFLNTLGNKPLGSVGVRACASNQEALNFSHEVADLLRAAGCEVHHGLTVGNPTHEALAIGVIGTDPENAGRASRLIDAFTAAKVDTIPVTTQIGGPLDEAVCVLIGPKPIGRNT